MLNSRAIKNLPTESLEIYTARREREHEVNGRRLVALSAKKERDPGWSFFSKDVDRQVSLDEVIYTYKTWDEMIADELINLIKERDRRRGINQTLPLF
jgi:hypothetical protein